MKLKKSGFVIGDAVIGLDRLPCGKAHPVRKLLRTMEVGAVLRIFKDEWAWMNKTPQVIMNEVSREQNKKFDFSMAADDSGWFIERLE